ncbi:Uncharacterised protein [Mycobacterium tuberculosis]|nr:Uncharacterised protein [Mycobacterium tuberculosis]
MASGPQMNHSSTPAGRRVLVSHLVSLSRSMRPRSSGVCSGSLESTCRISSRSA